MMREHKFLFICGLHRSGTSVLFQCLREHPLISGFKDTGVPEDEGQHLQTVYLPAKVYGGPGRFGFNPQAHLTEDSSLVCDINRQKLYDDWCRYWNTAKPWLLEKSPPNLIRTRFLQAMFPNAHFLVLTRHPAAVSFATQKWSKNTLYTLIKHWLTCHEIFQKDSQHINNLLVMKYEELVQQPEDYLKKIYEFLGIDHYPVEQKLYPGINEHYFNQWRKRQSNIFSRHYINFLIDSFEDRVNQFGYSLRDLDQVT